jgi:hypothetical protein
VIRIFFVGVLLGILAAAGSLYAFPAVDQEREASIISVAPNGGNVESFHINIPMDRVMTGRQGEGVPLPPGLNWPDDEVLANVRTEMFKIRNARDSVVGVGVRTAGRLNGETVIDWMLHLPARGSLFVSMEAVPRDNGFRLGQIRSGSREFAPLSGMMGERWVANNSDDEDAPMGRIELRTTYVGRLEELDFPADADEEGYDE